MMGEVRRPHAVEDDEGLGAPPRKDPDLSVEADLLGAGCSFVCGIDEVGRGAWAGPLVVGAVVVGVVTTPVPEGVRDSKLLTAKARESCVAPIRRWCLSSALGRVSSREIDEIGMSRALHLASARALDALWVRPDAVLLDGTFDFVTCADGERPHPVLARGRDDTEPQVHTIAKGDRVSGTIAAASILAKVARDRLMVKAARAEPEFGFDRNKGYGTPEHARAIGAHGLTGLHRQSWAIPGTAHVLAAPAVPRQRRAQ
jgi:ribonuclease HII